MKKSNITKFNKIIIFTLFLSLLMTGAFLNVSISRIQAEEITEVKYYHDNPEWQDYFEELSKLSEEEIGIGIKPVAFESTETLRMRVRTDLRTNKAPGLFKWWFGERARPIAGSGLVEDLSDVWDKTEANIKPGVRESLTMEGITYGMPYDVASWVWYYNKPVFEKYDLKPPETFDEFQEQLAFFEEKGIHPIGHAFGDRWNTIIMPMELMVRTDLEYYRKLRRGEGSWTAEPVVKAFEIWSDMLKKEYFPPTDWNQTDIAEAFSREEVAYIPMGAWFNSFFADLEGYDLDNVGVTMMPPITSKGEGVMIIEATNLMVPKNSPNSEAAKKWLEWRANSEKASQLFVSELGLLPWRTFLSEEEIQEASPVFTQINELDKEYPRKAIRFWEAFPTEFVEYAVDEFADLMLNPDKYMEILENLDQKADEVW